MVAEINAGRVRWSRRAQQLSAIGLPYTEKEAQKSARYGYFNPSGGSLPLDHRGNPLARADWQPISGGEPHILVCRSCQAAQVRRARVQVTGAQLLRLAEKSPGEVAI